jgi:3-dehydroquinate dehydratase type I
MHKLSPGDIIKIVTRSNKSRDNLVMLSLIHTCADYEMIGICMGKEGVETRITGPNYGSYLTFACLDGRPSAPGQISIGKLKKIWKDVYGYEGKQV